MTDFQQHLSRQLAFIERSCKSYDEGFVDEAIRIATCIRVILHTTRSSTSLLTHMGAESVELMTSCGPVSDTAFFFMGLGEWNLMGPIMEFRVSKPPMVSYSPLPAAEWWNQVVFILLGGTRITRKDIVLAAANKDGGAHVDPKLTTEYEEISKPGALFAQYHRGTGVSLGLGGPVMQAATGDPDIHSIVGVPDTHLVSLRQMGDELLNSTNLLKLAGRH